MCSSSSQDNIDCPGLILRTPSLSVQKTSKQTKNQTNPPPTTKKHTVPILGKEEKK